MNEKSLCIDVSHYNKDINYPLLKSNGVSTVVIKTSSGTQGADNYARIHITSARAAGLHIGLYHWIDPLNDGAGQAAHFYKFITEMQPEFIAGDLEQWWADWDLWRRYRTGDLPIEEVPYVSREQVNRAAHDFFNRLTTLTSLPQLCYSSLTYLNDRGRLVKAWLPEVNFWIAWWIHPKKVTRCTWDELRGFYPPSELNIPTGIPAPVLWQWSGDRFLLPGIKGSIDLNFILQPKKMLLPGDGIVKPITFVTAILKPNIRALNVRRQPDPNDRTNIIRVILPEEIIRLEKGQTGTWQKLFNEDAWIHTGYIQFQ